jgi:membrane protein YdbS with pleckstrin-like domain
MAQIDKEKEYISWIKIIFTIMIATDISLIGWLFGNYDEISQIVKIASLIVIGFMSIGIILINKHAINKINNLEKL